MDPSAPVASELTDPEIEARARAQVARPLEEQSEEVRARVAEAKRLTQRGVRTSIAEALSQLEASIEAGKSAGAPASEIERLEVEAASLRARLDRDRNERELNR